VWQVLWRSYGSPVFRHDDGMLVMLFQVMQKLSEQGAFPSEFFENRWCANLNLYVRTVKPILQFANGVVKPGFRIGTRGNGVDKPQWPDNLSNQVIE
jgi:hypothetical protein